MEKISTHQFLMLSAGVALGATFFPVGTTMASTAGRDGWMAVVPAFPAFLFGVPFGFMILTLAERYPQINLFEISERILGKGLGKILGIFVSLIAVYFGGLLFGQIIDMFSRSILSETPRYFLAFWGVQSLFGFKRWVAHILIILTMIGVAWTSLRGIELVNAVDFADSYLILPSALVWVVLLWGVSTWKQRIKRQSLNEG